MATGFDQHIWDIDQGRQNGFIIACSVLVGLGSESGPATRLVRANANTHS